MKPEFWRTGLALFIVLATAVIVWGFAGALILRFRYHLLYGLLGAIVLYWIVSAFR